METLSVITQEGQTTSAMPLQSGITFASHAAGVDVTAKGKVHSANTVCQNQEDTERGLDKGNGWFRPPHGSEIYHLARGQARPIEDQTFRDLSMEQKEFIDKPEATAIETCFSSVECNGCNHGTELMSPSHEDTSFSTSPVSSQLDPTCPPLVSLPVCVSEQPSPKSCQVNGETKNPRIIKHKPSSITFADYNRSPDLGQNAHESLDSGKSSSSSEDDDVFAEMIQCRDVFLCYRYARAGRNRGTEGSKGEIDSSSRLHGSRHSNSTGTTGYETDKESNSREVLVYSL